jgi:hypothetical protein
MTFESDRFVNRMWGRLLFAGAVMLPVLANAAACGVQNSASSGPTLRFPSGAPTVTAGSDLFGGSTLYHVDDVAFWSGSKAQASINEAGLTTLRFPGGGVGDNYDWETNSLIRPNEFPGEAKTDEEKKSRTDYLSFLAAAKKIGINDIFFVVNVDSAVRDKGDLDENLKKYADKAARWVKAVKDHGYTVKYWEIGNEMYLPSNPVTADEYARALNYYAKAMRAVDPSIKIGAVGPPKVDESGFGDKVGTVALKSIRQEADSTGSKPCEGERTRDCIKKFSASKGKGRQRERTEDWWPAVVARAKGSFDFAAVHRYRLSKFPQGGGTFESTDAIRQLKDYLRSAKGTDVPIAMTEWNIPGELHRQGGVTQIEQLMNVGILLGNYTVGGVTFAHFWPFRMLGKDPGTLLSRDGGLADVGRLFAVTSHLLPNAPVSEAALSSSVYALKVGGSQTRGTLIVNTGSSAVNVAFSDAAKGTASVTRFVGQGREEVTEQPCQTSDVSGGSLVVEAPAQSVTVMSLK